MKDSALLFSVFICLSCHVDKKYQHDVGYIDPKDAIQSESFKLCEETDFQYYNELPHAGYKHGKNALRKIIMDNYKLVTDENGYLTIRFIINCEGKTGRYAFVESDLSLNPKNFNDNVKARVFEILTNDLQEWNPLILNGQARDSYAYLMLKLENGKITEILP